MIDLSRTSTRHEKSRSRRLTGVSCLLQSAVSIDAQAGTGRRDAQQRPNDRNPQYDRKRSRKDGVTGGRFPRAAIARLLTPLEMVQPART